MFSGPLHGTAKNLVMMFMDKKVNRCFRNSLAACNALQVNLDVLVQLYFSWMCMMVFQRQQTNCFSAKLRFAFSGSCVMFFNYFMDKENVFGICDEFEVI